MLVFKDHREVLRRHLCRRSWGNNLGQDVLKKSKGGLERSSELFALPELESFLGYLRIEFDIKLMYKKDF